MMAENVVKCPLEAGGAAIRKIRKNVAKKSTTKPSASLLKQTVSLSDPNMVTLAAKLKVVMNGQQKSAPNQGHADGVVTSEAFTNGTDLRNGCLDTAKCCTSTDPGTDNAKKRNVVVVDTSEHITASQGDGDTKLVNTSYQKNLGRGIANACSSRSPGQNGPPILRLGSDGSTKPGKSGLVITPKNASYTRSLVKEAVSNVDVTLAHSPSGGASCSSTTHTPESTTLSKVMCDKGNLFDNLNDLSSDRNGRCDLDRKCVANSDSGLSLDEVTGRLTQVKAAQMTVLDNVADNVTREEKDILMDGIEDDTNLSDIDESILDDPSDQKLTMNGGEKKNHVHAVLATSGNKNLSVNPMEKHEEETSVNGQQSSICDSVTVKDNPNSDCNSLAAAASSCDLVLEKKSEAKYDGADTKKKASSISQHGDINGTHRKRVLLDRTETEPKKKSKFEPIENCVNLSCVNNIVETSSFMAATKNSTTPVTADEQGAISVTLGELDKLIKKHIDDDGSLASVLIQLQEKVAMMQANEESLKRKLTTLQRQVVEITQLQQHDLRRSHLRQKVQTRNWGIQVDEQKIKASMNGTMSSAKTVGSNPVKTDGSTLPISTSSHIRSLLRTVQSTMSEATVRQAASATSVRPAMSESAVRPAVSQTSVLLTTSSKIAQPVAAEIVQSSMSNVRQIQQLSTVQQLIPVSVSIGSSTPLMPVGTVLSRPAMSAGTVVSTQLQKLTPAVQQIHNNCVVTSTFSVKLQAGGSISTVAQTQSVTTLIGAKKIIDLTDDDDDACQTFVSTVSSAPIQTVSVRPTLTLPTGQLVVRQSSTPLQPGTFILQSSGTNPGTLYLQSSGVRGVPPTRAPTYIYPNTPIGGSGTFVLKQVANTSGTSPTVAQAQPRLQGVSAGMLLVTRPPPPLQSAPPVHVKTRLEKPVEKLHPAPLPILPVQNTDISLKLMPPKPSLKISRVQQGIVLSWSMSLDDAHAKISKYQLFAYQEGTQTPNSCLWKKIGDVNALPLPMACTLTQFQEGNKYHFAVRAVDVHERLGAFSDPSSIHLTKTV